ncbi:MAG: hypothetical protein Q9207_005084 [Kuettlingeria erythrocarpa]
MSYTARKQQTTIPYPTQSDPKHLPNIINKTNPSPSNPMSTNGQNCEECSQYGSSCPHCAFQYFLSIYTPAAADDGPTIDTVNPFRHHEPARRQAELHSFLTKHKAARATEEQLKHIFDLGCDGGLSLEDQERMVDFIEDPYCLYSLSGLQTLLQAALEMVRSMVVVVGRKDGVEDVEEEEILATKVEERSGTR